MNFVGCKSGLVQVCDANMESDALLLSDGGIGVENSDAVSIDE